MNFVVILLGAAAVGDLFQGIGVGQAWIGAAVAVVGAVQLVFDFGRSAREHQILQRDYFNLLADVVENTDPDTDTLARWQGRLIRITGEEPPVLRAMDAKAYNDAIDATEGFDEGERLLIPWHHRLLGRLFSFEGYRYRKLSELPKSHHTT